VKKSLLVLSTVSLLLGIFSFLLSKFDLSLSINKGFENIYFIFFAFTILSISFFYLQFGDEKNKKDEEDEIKLPKGNAEKDRIYRLIDDVESLKSNFERLVEKTTFSKDEKEDIKNIIITNSSKEFIEETYISQTEKLENKLLESLGLKSLKDSFFITINRLNTEIQKLYIRANINLLIGMAITMFGLYFLYMTIDSIKISLATSIPDIIISALPRFTLVIFLEIFSYFFLRLYKLGLDEIKYFQNELTNIESKLVAIEVAYITKNEEAMKDSLNILVQTERNFILKKGETTVELERAKSESENMQNILKSIPELFKNIRR
jgi:hypothetical protein